MSLIKNTFLFWRNKVVGSAIFREKIENVSDIITLLKAMNPFGVIASVLSVPLPSSSREIGNLWSQKDLDYSPEQWEEFLNFTGEYLSKYGGITYFGTTREVAYTIATKHLDGGFRAVMSPYTVFLPENTSVYKVEIRKG